jgi:hypothetical protein
MILAHYLGGKIRNMIRPNSAGPIGPVNPAASPSPSTRQRQAKGVGGRQTRSLPAISGGETTSLHYQLQLSHLDKKKRQFVQISLECYRLCLQTVSYCLQKGDRYLDEKNLRLLFQCADTCNNSISRLIRGSDLQAASGGLDDSIHERCAAICEEFSDDPQMVRLAELCRRCARLSRKLA